MVTWLGPAEQRARESMLGPKGTRWTARTEERPPEREGVPTEGDTAEDVPEECALEDTGETGEEPKAAWSMAASHSPGESVELQGDELDGKAHIGAALARVLARGAPAAAGAGEAEQGAESSRRAANVVPMDNNEVRCTRGQGAPSVRPEAAEVAERARPKVSRTDTRRSWAWGWCMRVDACRFADPQAPVP